MLAPQDLQRMLALRALGWGAKRISRESKAAAATRFGCTCGAGVGDLWR